MYCCSYNVCLMHNIYNVLVFIIIIITHVMSHVCIFLQQVALILFITENGRILLNPGDEIYIVGRSQQRGFLIAEYGGKQFNLPHQHTELRVSNISSSDSGTD